jgi:RNA recognition motif-containing protein
MKHNYTTPIFKGGIRKLLLIFSLLSWLLPVQAQIVLSSSSGTSTSANYSTLKAAFDNVNNGTHRGVILIEVHTNTSETAAINILDSGNVAGAAYAFIMIRPADTATVPKVINASGISGTSFITLTGADNIFFDGRPLSTGSAKLLTISQSANIAASHTIALTNGASLNTFAFCNIENGAIGTTASSAIRLLTGNNNENQVGFCTINGGNLGIEVAGTNGVPNNFFYIFNNLLTNQT